MFSRTISKPAAAAGAVVGAVALLAVSSAQADTVSPKMRSELRAAMEAHVEDHSIDGKFLFVNPAGQRIMSFDPADSFTLIVKVGEKFVLCSSFQTAEGKTTYMDFVILRSEGKARVVQVFAGQRGATRKMVEDHEAAKG